MSGHTKGPWLTQWEYDGGESIWSRDGGMHMIATCHAEDDRTIPAKANARLTAAAPVIMGRRAGCFRTATPVQPDSGGVVEALRESIAACKGEQEHFETWAKLRRYDMSEHPLHYIFNDPKTDAARMGWNAALAYVRDLAALAPVAAEGGVSHREKYQMIRDGGMSEHDLECSLGEGHTVAEIYAALEPFAEAARLAEASGSPPSSFVGAVEFERAASALRTEPTGGGEGA